MNRLILYTILLAALSALSAYLISNHYQNEAKYEQLALDFLSNEILPRMRNGDLQALSDWALPEVEGENGQTVQLERYISTISGLGALTEVNNAEGGFNTRAPWQSLSKPVADFTLQTTHTNGTATIAFTMEFIIDENYEEDSQWLITHCIFRANIFDDSSYI